MGSEPDQVRARGSWNLSERGEERRHREMGRRGEELRWCRCGEMGKISILTVELEIVLMQNKSYSECFAFPGITDFEPWKLHARMES